MDIPTQYQSSVQNRTRKKYILGLIVRAKKKFCFYLINSYARFKGAEIGENVIIPLSLARKANSNLHIGNDVIVETDDLDLRSKITIKDHVIINKKVSIIRVSHRIDNCPTYDTKYYKDLVIDSYSWLATSCTILPSVSYISVGSIIGACSVLTKDTEEDSVYSGNPAVLLRKHVGKFDQLVICSLMGGDYNYYKAAIK